VVSFTATTYDSRASVIEDNFCTRDSLEEISKWCQ